MMTGQVFRRRNVRKYLGVGGAPTKRYRASGLGLFIVRDIATHYDDDVALGTVLSGGLQAAVPLPGAILAKTS